MENSNGHSLYGPSKIGTIIACPGSVTMEEAVPEEGRQAPSEYAEHGSMLHEFTYMALTKGRDIIDNIEDYEDRSFVKDCIDFHDTLLESIGHNDVRKAYEKRVNLKQWGLPEVWGTLDFGLYDIKERHLYITDWKFGSGVPVYADMNAQLLTYAAGAITSAPVSHITLNVVQPPLDNFSVFTLSYDELWEWVHGTLAVAIGKSKSAEPTFNPGTSQCRWCVGKNHCVARFNWTKEQAARVFRNAGFANSIPREELIELIEIGPEIEAAIKEYRGFVMEGMQKGHVYEGLKLVRGRSIRRWKDEIASAAWLEENASEIEDLFTSKLISPAQAEKLARRLKKDEGFQALYETPEGKITIAPITDPRPAVEPQKKAVDIFAAYAEAPKAEEGDLS